MSKGGLTMLMDIFGNRVDFSSMPRGLKTPKLLNCKRLSARSSCLCVRKIEKNRACHTLNQFSIFLT